MFHVKHKAKYINTSIYKHLKNAKKRLSTDERKKSTEIKKMKQESSKKKESIKLINTFLIIFRNRRIFIYNRNRTNKLIIFKIN